MLNRAFGTGRRFHLILLVIIATTLCLLLLSERAYADFRELRNDNGLSGRVGSNYQSGYMAASILQGPNDWYPLRVQAIKFVMYRPQGFNSQANLRVLLYDVDQDGRPTRKLYESPLITVSLPEEGREALFQFPLSVPLVLNTPQAMAVVVDYLDGMVNRTPGLLTDTGHNISRNKNYFSRDGGVTWVEHYNFWRTESPYVMGYNRIWAIVETGVAPVATLTQTPLLAATASPTLISTPSVSQTPSLTPTASKTPTASPISTQVTSSTARLWQVYMPQVQGAKLLPPGCVSILPIDNRDGDNFYAVQWTAVPGAWRYILEEAKSPDFSAVRVVQSGAATQYHASNISPGIYYYRVRATNIAGDGAGCNLVSVVVAEPTTEWVIDNETGQTLHITTEDVGERDIAVGIHSWVLPSGYRKVIADARCGSRELWIAFDQYAKTPPYIFICDLLLSPASQEPKIQHPLTVFP